MKASVSWSHHCSVVQHQQQRPPDRDQRPGQAFQEAVTLPGIRRRSGAGAAATDRHEPGDFGAPGGIEGRHRRLDRIVSQPVRHRGQRQPPRRPEALRGRDHRALQPCDLGDLGHQAGLPHTSATADQHETAAARHGGPPHLLQHAELSGPAEKLCRGQPGAAGRWASSGRGPYRRAGVSHQALERPARRGVRRDAELALQHRRAMVVGADGPGPVAHIGLQLHQGAIADLLQRLQLDPAPGRLHRPGQVTRSRPCRAGQVAQVHALAFKLRPGVEQPVFVHAGQQLTPVRGDRRGGMPQDPVVITGSRRRQGRFAPTIEDAHVDAARLRVTPAQIPGRHHERWVVSQDLAQVVQFAAQVGQCLRIRGLGPEQAGDTLPGLRGSGVDDQECDQDDNARRPGPDASGPVISDGLLAQERHMQHVDPSSSLSKPTGMKKRWSLCGEPMEIQPGCPSSRKGVPPP